MARALLVGCGCRGRSLGGSLLAEGWSVRGTSRSDAGLAAIAAAGIEAVRADPDRLATVTDLIGDVTVLAWLMGSARAAPGAADDRGPLAAGSAGATVNGPRLESLLGRLVDTPVRGFLFEARGSVPAELLEAGAAMAEDASDRWRIPVAILRADPADPAEWTRAAKRAVGSLLA